LFLSGVSGSTFSTFSSTCATTGVSTFVSSGGVNSFISSMVIRIRAAISSVCFWEGLPRNVYSLGVTISPVSQL